LHTNKADPHGDPPANAFPQFSIAEMPNSARRRLWTLVAVNKPLRDSWVASIAEARRRLAIHTNDLQIRMYHGDFFGSWVQRLGVS